MQAAFSVALWAATFVRLPTLLRDRRQRALWFSLFALTLVKTVVAAGAGPPILPHLLGVVAASFLLRFVTLVTSGRGLLGQALLTAAVEGTLITLAVLSGGVGTSADVLEAPMAGTAVAYWVVLEAYLGMVLVIAAVLFWTVGRAAPAGLPRWGLRAMAAGSLLVAVYAAARASLIIVHGTGVAVDFGALEPAGRAVQVSGLLLLVAGGIVPAGRRTRAIIAATRDLIVLRPLWTAMRDAFPQVILFTPRRALIELAGVDDVRLRRYRRVIEIRDGLLALRDYLPAGETSECGTGEAGEPRGGGKGSEAGEGSEGRAGKQCEGGAGKQCEGGAGKQCEGGAGKQCEGGAGKQRGGGAGDPAVAEAERIAAALRSRADGVPKYGESGRWAQVGAEMDDEIAWLSRVSRAYKRVSARTPTPAGSAR